MLNEISSKLNKRLDKETEWNKETEELLTRCYRLKMIEKLKYKQEYELGKYITSYTGEY